MDDPRNAENWDWDEANEAELADHQVSAAEVEQVWMNGPVVLPNRKERAGDWKVVGRSNGGRALTVILRYDAVTRTLHPITGWDSPVADKTRYLE